jgi:DNA repair protein RecN (Recombination protein N)
MLRELRIRNLAIIDNTVVEFGEGFNVLTGETGAGKSIIIGALCLALGERAGGELIRSGESEAVVEAFFDLPPQSLGPPLLKKLKDMGIEVSEGFILKRIISAQGKNRAYLNGSMVNVQTLSELSRCFIDIHGQYEHQSLLSSESQMELLDSYGGLLSEKEKVGRLYEEYTGLQNQISELKRMEKERAQRLDMLSFQIDEINTAGLIVGEDEELEKEARVLSNAGHLAELANNAYESLYSSESSCISGLSKILGDLKKISGIDNAAIEPAGTLEGAIPLLEETAYFLRDYRENLNFSPERLDSVQARTEHIRGLKRKYGERIEGILDYKDKAEEELELLQHSEEKLEGLSSEVEAVKKEFTLMAKNLSHKRADATGKIEPLLVEELSGLSMPDSGFMVRISQKPGDDTSDGYLANSNGIDQIEFLISPNKGEAHKPLSKIASGGELSRIMLALKSIITGGDNIPVIVFDEIDAGIGGATAERVGQKLKGLSAGHQVICITHLPQIASYAERHLRIEKKVSGERTTVEVREIHEDERTTEIARMLSGDISEVSLRHAKELLQAKTQ